MHNPRNTKYTDDQRTIVKLLHSVERDKLTGRGKYTFLDIERMTGVKQKAAWKMTLNY